MVSDRRNGIYRGLVLALGLILLWSESPRAQGVSSPSPAPKEQPDRQANGRRDQPPPIRVEIIESAEQAKRNESREDKSDHHDSKDLQAQIRAAEAAEKQILPTWLAAILSGIGAILIIWTLLLTRKTNEISKRAARAFMQPAFKLTEGNRFAAPRIAILGRNVGETTAQNVISKTSWANEVPSGPESATEASFAMTAQAHGEVSFTLIERDPPDAIGFYLFGTISYTCSFGDIHKTHFCVRAEQAIPDPSIGNRGEIVFVPCKPANWPADT